VTRLVMAVRQTREGEHVWTDSEPVEVEKAGADVCFELDDGTRLIFDASELAQAVEQEEA
jgi:hypothetical protein